MKLVRYGDKGSEKPGLIDSDGKLRDLSEEVLDISPELLSRDSLDRLRALDPATLPEVGGNPRLGVPVSGIPKIMAVGQNYLTHIREMGYTPPSEPVLFNKAISSLTGPYDPIIKPKTSTELDYEVELACVIGRRALNVSPDEALDYVAGYALMNDGSERHYQRSREGGTTKGKSADTLGPLGPWLVTTDEVGDPQQLRIWTKINGELRQDGHTSDMVFGMAQIVSYISEFMSLNPGDVVTTGSPHGVAAGFDPPRWLQPGDLIEMGIDGLGEQRHEVVAYPG
jgi:2,4-diketo-3-deoxy-L-fuconate hydrolase